MQALRVLGLLAVGAVAGLAAAAGAVRHALATAGDERADELALAAIFDGVKLSSRAEAFRGGRLLAWFGGVQLDLSEARLAPGARLSVHALFGGIAIRVPPEWRIDSDVRVLAGGVDVRRSEPDDAAAPTLTLDGLALFGGVAVGPRVADAAFTR